jgi:hypothetical protein
MHLAEQSRFYEEYQVHHLQIETVTLINFDILRLWKIAVDKRYLEQKAVLSVVTP